MAGSPRDHLGIERDCVVEAAHPPVGVGGGQHDLGALVPPHGLEEVAERGGVVAPGAGQLAQPRVRGGMAGLAAQQRLESGHRRGQPARHRRVLTQTVELGGQPGRLPRLRTLPRRERHRSGQEQAERDGEHGTGRKGARGEDPEGQLHRETRSQRDGNAAGTAGGEVGDGAAGDEKDDEGEPDRHGDGRAAEALPAAVRSSSSIARWHSMQ